MKTDELRALLAAATPGPWGVFQESVHDPVVINTPERIVCEFHWYDHKPTDREPDAHLIVAAVNALPGLLDEIERLRAALGTACDRIVSVDEFWREETDVPKWRELASDPTTPSVRP